MQPVSFKVLTALVILTLLIGCAGSDKKPADSPLVQKLAVKSAEPSVEHRRPVLAPEHQAQFDAGVSAMKNRDYDSARRSFDGLLVIYPKLAGAHVNLALIDEAQNNSEAAFERYQKALDINPRNVEALIQRALFSQRQGRFLESEQYLLRAEAASANNQTVHYNLGVLYELYLQNFKLAMSHYQRYVDLSSDDDVEVVKRWMKLLERK